MVECKQGILIVFGGWLKDASVAKGPPILPLTKKTMKAAVIGDKLYITNCLLRTYECRVAVSASPLLSIHAFYRSSSWACISASPFPASKAGCSAE
jgi:hypothetical protein